ncbi:MAG: hypothetical protein DRN30_06180 [Thermoplasmata archaeon]|nr:MAG: hypothetical protein DRN30_06180 [Thermoplasmata archaeon]
MKEQHLEVRGTWTMKVHRKDGSCLEVSFKNLITKLGLDLMASTLAGVPIVSNVLYLALGTGLTAPTEADTALEAESLRELSTVTTLIAPDENKVQFHKLWAEGEVVGTFTEAGLFTAATVGEGIMFNRNVFTAVPVTVTDTFEVTWVVEFLNVGV